LATLINGFEQISLSVHLHQEKKETNEAAEKTN